MKELERVLLAEKIMGQVREYINDILQMSFNLITVIPEGVAMSIVKGAFDNF